MKKNPRIVADQLVRRSLFCALLVAATALPTSAFAKRRPGRSIEIGAGVGLTTPERDLDIDGIGAHLRGEYVIDFASWIGARAYGGMLLTFKDTQDAACGAAKLSCETTAKVGLAGLKIRLTAPVPYVAPFFEIGFGLSLGRIRTLTPDTNKTIEGATYHVPATLGVGIGPNHQYVLALSYYFHPEADQIGAVIGVSFEFPLPGRP